jgi:hypothetical protein
MESEMELKHVTMRTQQMETDVLQFELSKLGIRDQEVPQAPKILAKRSEETPKDSILWLRIAMMGIQ